ncbi:MAG: MBL fold metallo-hydrolase [Desulfurococcales archaeon]|nr:MBL fold metallo-hydrolase [Desulfurococcales archaeon]
MGGYGINVKPYKTLEFPLSDPSILYMVKVEDKRILIDAGAQLKPPIIEEPDYILITHWHWDHIMGIASLTRSPICMSSETFSILSEGLYTERFRNVLRAGGISLDEPSVKMVEAMFSERYDKVAEALDRARVYLDEECPLVREGMVDIVPCHGHSIDHVCYIIGDSIFTGDTILEPSRPTIIDFEAHRDSILKILTVEWRTLYPGHGRMLNRDTAYRVARELTVSRCRRVYDIIKVVAERGEISLEELMREIYGFGPSIQMFVPLRTLIGYLVELEKTKMIIVDRESSPWIIRMR